MTKPTDPTPTDAKKTPNQQTTEESRGPIRNTLESFGMAVLMAILLKYFALEAYVIPTPSMQPTLMGSPAEGESDRILVDKLYYLLHEPKRWDIFVFRYPVRKIQSYVKRCVGVGGDRLRIAGGNLYNVSKDGKTLEILRKPETIQRTLWREIYPMRRLLAIHESGGDPSQPPTKGDVFGRYWNRGAGKWDIGDDGTWVVEPSSRGRADVSFSSRAASNNYSDGYDLGLAAATRTNRDYGPGKDKCDQGQQAVQDLRISFGLTPKAAVDELTVAIDIPGAGTLFSLEVANGKGVLIATRKSDQKTATSEPFDFAIPTGTATTIQFVRLDDRLLAWHDGTQVGSFDVDAFAIRRRLDTLENGQYVLGKVVPKIKIQSKGESRLSDVTVERDLHYTHSQLPEDTIIEVPAGHYYMMGDNTLGSADSRDWRALRVGIKDGKLVDPAKHADAKIVWGNKRTKRFDAPDRPHDDDNPVPMQYRDVVVFIDELGEIRGLEGKVDPKRWGSTTGNGQSVTLPNGATEPFAEFLTKDGGWMPHEQPRSFVPRHHIQGRPVARFLRSLPFKLTSWIR